MSDQSDLSPRLIASLLERIRAEAGPEIYDKARAGFTGTDQEFYAYLTGPEVEIKHALGGEETHLYWIGEDSDARE